MEKDRVVQVRVSAVTLERWREAASPYSVPAWVRAVCDAACGGVAGSKAREVRGGTAPEDRRAATLEARAAVEPQESRSARKKQDDCPISFKHVSGTRCSMCRRVIA